MASSTPSPNSSPSAVPPASTTSPPPPSSPSTTLPISQPNANPPETSSPPPAVPATPLPVNPIPVPPLSVPLSPPPPPTSPPVLPPPPSPLRAPPPDVTSPPPPILSPPPPQAVSPSPSSPANIPPPSPPNYPPPLENSPPPPSSKPPESSPPPPSSEPPESSPPPPSSEPPESSPPPPSSEPPENSPPPPSSKPPESSPPPPSSKPPESSPPPPSSKPPKSSPPPPSSKPPKSSPPPPLSKPPENSPPAPSGSQPAPPPSLNSPPSLSPPPPRDPPRPNPPPPSLPSPPPPPDRSSPQTPVVPSNDPIAVNPNTNPTGGGGIESGGTIAVGIVVGFIVLSFMGMAVWCVRKQKKNVAGYNGGYIMPSPLGSSQQSDSSYIINQSSAPLRAIGSSSGSDFIYSPTEPGGLGNSRSWFTYEELVQVTNGFSTQNLLGEGGFGCVYKGCLVDGREVAVKQLKIGGAQGEREFRAEVEIISRVHHRHLVSLVGYCISDHQRLLIYDYVPNDTLDYHLHGERRPVMDWATRVKIAAGAARGIAYLHEDCHPRIIHRDIKSSNILLDSNFEAQVSDFGLAKLAQDANTHVTTRVMGTFGYMAPEYASSGKLSEKSDVYSFGVVLLELITGRKPVDASQPLGDESLVEWARPLLNHALDNEDFEGLTDPRLENNYVDSEMFRMIEAAAACVRHSAIKRPRMGQLVRALDCVGDSSDLTNGMRPGQSEVFDSAQQSAEIRMFQRMAFASQDYSTDFFRQSSQRS
ncbi:hypothetical protein HHK36_029835 [Tetracentron sinense]|uniref:non-specific serine/threonine protein kinase n=1 Tax=Tetracentron sinense TaxID=13715 RepID=A0A835D2Z0_TETSI|nr:hypothetical protein HHK36_029835 [Tetracentron sinense]